MPRNTPSQLAGLPAPRSPASALNNAAAAAAMSAGFNAAYAASAGQLSCPSEQSLYHQNSQSNACSFERMSAYTTSHKPAPHVYCYVYNGIISHQLLVSFFPLSFKIFSPFFVMLFICLNLLLYNLKFFISLVKNTFSLINTEI
jgi:hypothetical protein